MIAENLKKLRSKRKETLQEWANLSSVPLAKLNKIETKKHKGDFATLEKILSTIVKNPEERYWLITGEKFEKDYFAHNEIDDIKNQLTDAKEEIRFLKEQVSNLSSAMKNLTTVDTTGKQGTGEQQRVETQMGKMLKAADANP